MANNQNSSEQPERIGQHLTDLSPSKAQQVASKLRGRQDRQNGRR